VFSSCFISYNAEEWCLSTGGVCVTGGT